MELKLADNPVIELPESDVQTCPTELNDLHLLMVGGGVGEVIVA